MHILSHIHRHSNFYTSRFCTYMICIDSESLVRRVFVEMHLLLSVNVLSILFNNIIATSNNRQPTVLLDSLLVILLSSSDNICSTHTYTHFQFIHTSVCTGWEKMELRVNQKISLSIVYFFYGLNLNCTNQTRDRKM